MISGFRDMDPISLAASIADLVTLATALIQWSTKYASDLRHARKDLADFIQELTYLKGVLSGLDAFLKLRTAAAPPGDTLLHNLGLPHGAIDDCRSAMESITKSLEKCERNPGAKRRKLNAALSFKSHLTWPLTKEMTENHMRRVERLKCTFTLALSADGL